MPLTKVSAGVIAANAVVDSFGTQSITGDKLGLTAINANNIVDATITGAKISSNTISNTAFQTGSVENYMREANLGFGLRNRIINGAMVIDQRNAGANVTVNSGSNFFIADRWFANGESADGVFTGQQVTTAPTGFNNSLEFTVTTADASIGATQGYTFRQRIEGYNFADLGWGTANAKTITISFWVRSSLTGTFGGSLFNGDGDRAYAFSFSISSANTFEYKTITIAGDTTGTWSTTNGTALNLVFSLGVGSTYKGTAGAWGSTFYFAPTGSVDLISTLNATFYITGVQLEVGSTATSFDYRPYGTELALCQRYYQKTYDVGTVPGTTYDFEYAAPATAIGTGNFGMPCGRSFLVAMRATPTITTYDGAGNAGRIAQWSVGNNQSYAGVGATQNQITAFDFGNNTTAGRHFPFAFVASAEL